MYHKNIFYNSEGGKAKSILYARDLKERIWYFLKKKLKIIISEGIKWNLLAIHYIGFIALSSHGLMYIKTLCNVADSRRSAQYIIERMCSTVWVSLPFNLRLPAEQTQTNQIEILNWYPIRLHTSNGYNFPQDFHYWPEEAVIS